MSGQGHFWPDICLFNQQMFCVWLLYWSLNCNMLLFLTLWSQVSMLASIVLKTWEMKPKATGPFQSHLSWEWLQWKIQCQYASLWRRQNQVGWHCEPGRRRGGVTKKIEAKSFHNSSSLVTCWFIPTETSGDLFSHSLPEKKSGMGDVEVSFLSQFLCVELGKKCGGKCFLSMVPHTPGIQYWPASLSWSDRYTSLWYSVS